MKASRFWPIGRALYPKFWMRRDFTRQREDPLPQGIPLAINYCQPEDDAGASPIRPREVGEGGRSVLRLLYKPVDVDVDVAVPVASVQV